MPDHNNLKNELVFPERASAQVVFAFLFCEHVSADKWKMPLVPRVVLLIES